jgi:hypothetical protein
MEYQKKIDEAGANKKYDDNFVVNCKAYFSRLMLDE